MNIQEYIDLNYNGSNKWFENEVRHMEHTSRISKVVHNKSYLKRVHKILSKPDVKWKNQIYTTRKTVYNMLKNVCNYHTVYTLGKPVSLVGAENTIKTFNDIYRKSRYDDIDYTIYNKVLKFADCGEFIFIGKDCKGNNIIKSHIINPEDFYPVYSETNDYVACIEHWIINNVSYYTVYYPDKVERWNNDGGSLQMIEQSINVSGLPIHYHNMSDEDDCFGESFLEDIIPLVDEFEDFINRLADGIHTLSTNPMGVLIGNEMADAAPVEGVGYTISLSGGGDYKFAVANMDYQTIKYYMDNHLNKLSEACKMPTVGHGQTNIANVSEEVIRIIYEDTDKFSKENQKWLKRGMLERFSIIAKLLDKQGISLDDEYIDISFNVDRPTNDTETIDNIIKLVGKNLMSKQTAMELNPYITNVSMETERLNDKSSVDSNTDNANANYLQ